MKRQDAEGIVSGPSNLLQTVEFIMNPKVCPTKVFPQQDNRQNNPANARVVGFRAQRFRAHRDLDTKGVWQLGV